MPGNNNNNNNNFVSFSLSLSLSLTSILSSLLAAALILHAPCGRQLFHISQQRASPPRTSTFLFPFLLCISPSFLPPFPLLPYFHIHIALLHLFRLVQLHFIPASPMPKTPNTQPSPPSKSPANATGADRVDKMSEIALRKKKNADAQAAFRARRANYIATLEETGRPLSRVSRTPYL